MNTWLFIIGGIIIVTFIIYRKNKIKKERPWATKEAHDRYLRERKERETTNAQKEKTAWEEAYAQNSQKDFDNEFIQVGRKLLEKRMSPESYLKILYAIGNPQNIKILFKEPDEMKLGDITHVYAKNRHSEDSDILKYLSVEDSPMGAWQALLLTNMYKILPLWWHAGIEGIDYIFSYEDIKKVKVLNALINYEESLAPVVTGNNGQYKVSYCYWNDWQGLVRCSTPIIIDNGAVVIKDSSRKIIHEYNCGIIY